MLLKFSDRLEQSSFVFTDFSCADGSALLCDGQLYKIILAKDNIAGITIDGYNIQLKKNDLLFCTPLNYVSIPLRHKNLTSLVFNREFYCIKDNDDEVSCDGFLFYGSTHPIVIPLNEDESSVISQTFGIMIKELQDRKKSHAEMLRLMLKRLVIISNRKAKDQIEVSKLPPDHQETIRQFHILVEKHFRSFHKVSEYAPLLEKSSKTLSNIFSKYSKDTPLSVINSRIILEARRLLLFSNLPIKEISQYLGFSNASHFSKFFKNYEALSPTQLRKM